MKKPARIGKVCVAVGLLTAVLQANEIYRAVTTPRAVRLRWSEPAPALRFTGVDGRAHDLTWYRGSQVVVTFWASWCIPCRAELPELARTARGHGTHPGIVVLAINTADRHEDARDVVTNPEYASIVFGYDLDGSLARAWGVDSIPTTFFVSPSGILDDVLGGYDPHLRVRLSSWSKRGRRAPSTEDGAGG